MTGQKYEKQTKSSAIKDISYLIEKQQQNNANIARLLQRKQAYLERTGNVHVKKELEDLSTYILGAEEVIEGLTDRYNELADDFLSIHNYNFLCYYANGAIKDRFPGAYRNLRAFFASGSLNLAQYGRLPEPGKIDLI